MSAADALLAAKPQRDPTRSSMMTRIVIYGLLGFFAIIYLLPLIVMVMTSLKPLDEVTGGNIFALPGAPSFDAWEKAWGATCVGLTCEGIKGYFWNSIKMVIPAVLISTLLGALNGYVLPKWRFAGPGLGFGNAPGKLAIGHTLYGLGFTPLFFRNFYEAFPTELVKSAMIDGAGFFQIFRRIMLPNSGPIFIVTVIYQFTNIWNDFLFGATFAAGDQAPMTVALYNIVNTSTGVVEYNTNMAAAMIAAAPTLVVYVLAGRYFVSGLMAGAVKG